MKKIKIIYLTLFPLFMLVLTPAASLGLGVGDNAPPFTGESSLGTIQSTDYLGQKNIVLALYFAAFTPV